MANRDDRNLTPAVAAGSPATSTTKARLAASENPGTTEARPGDVLSKASVGPHASPDNSFSGPADVQEKAVDAALHAANHLNAALRFNTNSDGLEPLTRGNCSYKLRLIDGALEGNICTSNHVVAFILGDFELYSDKRLRQQALVQNPGPHGELGKVHNYLTTESAVALVRQTMTTLGVAEDRLRALGSPDVRFPPVPGAAPIYQITFPGEHRDPYLYAVRAEVLGSVPGGRITQLNVYGIKVLPRGMLQISKY